MEAFQRDHPDIDLRIDASDVPVDMDTADIDLALRYSLPGARLAVLNGCLATVGGGGQPWLLKSTPPVRQPADVARFTLIEAGDAHRSLHLEWLSWRRWFDAQGCPSCSPSAGCPSTTRTRSCRPRSAARPGAGAPALDCRRTGPG